MNTEFETLKKLVADHRKYHSYPQIETMIVGRGGKTRWGQYRQAVRELYSRFRRLQELMLDREEKILDLEDAELELTNCNLNGRDTRRTDIEIERARVALDCIALTLKEVKREFDAFFDLAQQLKKEVGEPTPAEVKELDREHLIVSVKMRACLDILTINNLSAGTIERLSALTGEERLAVLNFVKDPIAVAEWMRAGGETAEPVLISDEYRPLTFEDIEKQELIG